MKNIVLSLTAAEIDSLLLKVKDGSVVTDNTAQTVIAGETKPVSSDAVAAALKTFTDAIQTTLTPSGDPMHYAYEAVGAVYNNTDTAKEVAAPWGDMVTHVARRWYLNGLGDITNEQILKIYNLGNSRIFRGSTLKDYIIDPVRTNIPRKNLLLNNAKKAIDINEVVMNNSDIAAVQFSSYLEYPVYLTGSMSYTFYNCGQLMSINNVLNVANVTTFSQAFGLCPNLIYVYMQSLNRSVSFSSSSKLSKASLLYMIQNAAPTSAITITLHADAYARLANDADIVAALKTQPLITIISA